MAKKKLPTKTDDEIRDIMLEYFYDRNKNASSRFGKKGSAVSISDMRKDLKAQKGLDSKQVNSNLTYLLSNDWVDEFTDEKKFKTPSGDLVPSVKRFYVITALGIDKIDGPTKYTKSKYEGINITGQNIITIGDGNEINAKYENVGNSLSELEEAIKDSKELSDTEKLDYVSDIQSMQAQLAKPEPNKSIIKTIFTGLGKIATLEGVQEAYVKAQTFIEGILTN